METYDKIYERMKQKYIEESSVTFDDGSEIAIKLKVLAGEIYNATVNLEWLKNQMFVNTASGEYLDYMAQQRGLTRKSAQKAQGELVFSISNPIDHSIVIPTGTVVATMDAEPLRFITTEDEEITAGNTLVAIYAEAEKPGKSGNIQKGQAVVAVSVPAEVETVTNREVFIDGTDEESDDDLRERIKNSFINRSNSTNAEYYEKLALSVEGISKAGVVGRARGNGTVNIYVCGKGVEASETAIEKLQAIVDVERELNVSVKVLKAALSPYDLYVTVKAKSGYEEEEVREKLIEAFKDCINSHPMGKTLYLSAVGKCLMDTECIDYYTFDVVMTNMLVSLAECIVPGEMEITVI